MNIPDPGDVAADVLAEGVKDKKKPKVNPWVDNIESLVVAVILALIIRVFVLEAFVIPTGSMAATLYGDHFEVVCDNCGFHYALGASPGYQPILEKTLCPNCGYKPVALPPSPSGGDRILVNKVIYRFEKPKRWDPFVFVNPTCRKDDNPPKTTYIKRLAGLPGDRLEIIRGDLVVNGTIARKPAGVQEDLWMPVYNSDYPWRDRPDGKPWKTPGNAWRLEGKRLVVDAKGDATWSAEYSGRLNDPSPGTIRDTYGYDYDLKASPDRMAGNGAGLNVVTDLRVKCEVAGSSGTLVLALRCDDVEDCAALDLGAGKAFIARQNVVVDAPATPFGEGRFAAAGASRTVEFSRVDGLLTLKVDGKVVVTKDLWSKEEYERMKSRGIEQTLEGWRKSGVRLAASKAQLELSHVRVDRDVYYTNGLEGRSMNQYRVFNIPEGCYFALGDNSPESWDSRHWAEGGMFDPWVPADHLIGKALVTWWFPTRIGFIH